MPNTTKSARPKSGDQSWLNKEEQCSTYGQQWPQQASIHLICSGQIQSTSFLHAIIGAAHLTAKLPLSQTPRMSTSITWNKTNKHKQLTCIAI